MTDFCSLSVSISHLGHVPSFLGKFSHDTIFVASSFSFLNVLKSYCLVWISWRKMQKTKKKPVLRRIFYLISPQQEHFRTKFKQILEAIVCGYNFHFLTILGERSCDHPPAPPSPTTHQIDPNNDIGQITNENHNDIAQVANEKSQ
jgi:hypothetical protein